MLDKIKTREDLMKILPIRRAQGRRIVFTNGCFDLLHIGHVRYLQAAHDMGDIMIVAVNTDASVRMLSKGNGRPIVPQAQRAEVLAALACVDYVVLFDEADPGQLIVDLKPDVLVKGGDWKPEQIVGRESVEARGGIVRTIPLVPDVSTTTLVDKIRGGVKSGT
ncbi:MAG: glycerol-3-phosphate cytidylyltransferase [Nitrospirae bacterium RIFCSPLOWO2_02_FULL_62_14]|nr:MAG: glycerol-3-phosphate cytidylyltransferase [Nitrospirae bacterium RIFCSPLOWO2_02_FULL_62_14]